MGLRHLRWINQHRILPLALLRLILNDSLHDTFHHSNALKGKVHRTLWGTLLEVIRATQSLSWRAQILETRPATAHPQWRIIQPSQVYCEKGNATDESTPRRNTKRLCEVFVKLLGCVLACALSVSVRAPCFTACWLEWRRSVFGYIWKSQQVKIVKSLPLIVIDCKLLVFNFGY